MGAARQSFGAILSEVGVPGDSKIVEKDNEKSILKKSWKAILSPKMRPRGAADAARWRGGTKAKVQGEDYGGDM